MDMIFANNFNVIRNSDKLSINMETGCKKVTSIVNYYEIPKVADDETRIFYLKIIGDYYKNTAKTGGLKSSKIRKSG